MSMNSILIIIKALYGIKTVLSFFICNKYFLSLAKLIDFSRLFINNRSEIKAILALEIEKFFTEKRTNTDGFLLDFQNYY